MFPSCSIQNGSLLPCQETCRQVYDCYGTIKEVILSHDRDFYEHLRTDCLLLGKQQNGKCAYKAMGKKDAFISSFDHNLTPYFISNNSLIFPFLSFTLFILMSHRYPEVPLITQLAFLGYVGHL